MSLKDLLTYSKDLNILYVEDEEITQELYTHIFDDIFSTVNTASNGVEALQMYLLHEYDIVISDLCMPKMGGIELCRRVLEKNPLQCIVIMTAYSDDEPIKEIQNLGINTFLSKPIQNEDLINILYEISKKVNELKS